MQLTDLKIQISCHKDFLVSFFITPSFFYLNDFVLTFTFTDDSAIRYPVSGSLLYSSLSSCITKFCLYSSGEMSRTSRILLFIFLNLQFTTRCCNTFDELFLEDQIQYDHRDTCKQRCCHQLRIIVGVLSLHFCKCC